MQLEDLKTIQKATTVAATDLFVVAKTDSKTPKAVAASNVIAQLLANGFAAYVGTLPTTDPEVEGALFVDTGGVLTVSAGA
jgi:hypothetical protein